MFCLPLQFWPEGNALHIPDQQEKLYSVSLKPRISGFRVCAAPRLTHRQFLQLSSHCSFSKPVLNKSTEMCLQLPNTASSEPTAGSEGHCRHRADTSVPHFCHTHGAICGALRIHCTLWPQDPKAFQAVSSRAPSPHCCAQPERRRDGDGCQTA